MGRLRAETINAGDVSSTHPIEWHEARGLGGSDIGPLMSDGALEIYNRMTRPIVNIDEPLTVDQFRGHALEPLMRSTFTKHTGRTVRRHRQRSHRKYPWATVNIDGQVLASNGDPTAGFEAKAPRQHIYKDILEGGYRIRTALQMQWGSWVTSYGQLYFMACNLESDPPFTLFDLEADEGLIGEITVVARRFIEEHVEPRIPPDPAMFDMLGSPIRDATRDLALEAHYLSDINLEISANDYAEARRIEKEGKEDKAAAAELLRAYMAGHKLEEAISGRWKVTHKQGAGRSYLNDKGIRAHRPLDRDAFVRWARGWAEMDRQFTSEAEIESVAQELELDLGRFTATTSPKATLNVRDLKGEL